MSDDKNADKNLEELFERLTAERKALEERLKETEGVLRAIDEKMSDFKARQTVRMEADKNISAETNRRMTTQNERGGVLKIDDQD
jgi:phage shock protein A